MSFAGPAFYNILNYGIEAENLKKAVLEKRKKGAFGSSAPRLLYLVKREAFTTPGPADYQVYFQLKKTTSINCSVILHTHVLLWLLGLLSIRLV